jgi:hypothetical protein
MKSFELNGYWWLSSNPDKTIAGTLKFDTISGGSLNLLGSFQDLTKFGQVFDVDIILGFADGRKVTLYRCYATGSNMSLITGGPVALKSSFIVNIILLGHHFEKKEDIVFKSLSVNYSYLEDWTQISGFKFSLQSDKENHFSQYEVKYNFPEKLAIKVDNVSISFDYNFRDGGDRIKEVKLVQNTFIKVEPPRECHIDEYFRNFFYHIQNFISLGVGKAVYPLIMKGKNENCRVELEKGRIVYNDIEVFYRARDFQEASKKLHPLDMVFFLGDVKDEFKKYLNNWFKKAELIQPVYDLYFATLYSPKMYLQHEFLSLIQALEVYHRRVHGGKYLSDDNFKDIYAKLVDAIPGETEADFKASLVGKMKYLHEYSLRKRLKKITDDLKDVIGVLIKDVNTFIENIESTRNFLTHYDKSLEDKKKDGHELYILTEQMKFLLEMCFLSEIGMTEGKIKQLVTRNHKYQYLTRSV